MASRGKLADCFARLERCDVDPQLLDIVQSCLALEPEDRPKNASIVSAQISSYRESIESRLREAEIAAVRAQAAAEQERQRRRRVVWTTVIAIVLLVVAGTIGLAVRSVFLAKQRAIRAEGLVDTLLSADVAEVPYILSDMEPHRKWVNPRLETESHKLADGSAQKMHVALALLPVDEGQIDYLRRQLPVCTLDQFPVVRDALYPHGHRITDALWQLAEDEQQEAGLRFQTAAALATYSPEQERWAMIAPFIANQLTHADLSISLERWLTHFEPASPHFSESLATILEDRGHSQKQREAAAFALAVFLKDKPAELADVILLADEFAEFSPLITALQPHSEAIRLQLLDEIHAPMPDSPTEAQREALWNRQSLAAVALVQLGHADEAWPLLEFTPDTSLRSLFIHHLGKLRADDEQRAAKMESEDDAAIRQALIESFGSQHKESITAAVRDRVIQQLQKLYRDDPDPGVHASASWTLRNWDVTPPELPRGEARLLTDEQVNRVAELTDEGRREWERQLQTLPLELPASLHRGLVAHYPLDGIDGVETANAVDGKPGGIYQGPDEPKSVPGVMGRALAFDGEGAHVDCGNVFDPGRTDKFSYGCWFNAATNDQTGCLLSKMGALVDGSGKGGFRAILRGNSLQLGWIHRFPENRLTLTFEIDHEVDRWHHLVVTYDGTAKGPGVQVFVDGQLASSQVTGDTLTDSIRNISPVKIGQQSSHFPFHGRIDDVRIWDRQLEAEETRALYDFCVRALARLPAEDRTVEQKVVLTAAARPAMDAARKAALQVQLATAENTRQGESSPLRRWYINSQGQTMTMIPSPQSSAASGIDYDFAIASHEVTVADFSKFRRNHLVKRTAANGNFPVQEASWYLTAQYCNWLSKQDGIEMDQWIYEPNAAGSFLDGMTVKATYRELEGYRLPSSEEWEYACRAGTTSTFSFGEPESLIDHYGHTIVTSKGLSQPVGSLLPNRLGLFDMHGSLWEWCLDPPNGRLSPVRAQGSRVLRGGSYGRRPRNAGSSQAVANPANYKDDFIGFRVARSLPNVKEGRPTDDTD
jgi:formylglycine-generating enzyme required for sulfatase activity